MVRFFVEKIKTGTVNPDTGEVWKAEDVPKLWRMKVAKELEG